MPVVPAYRPRLEAEISLGPAELTKDDLVCRVLVLEAMRRQGRAPKGIQLLAVEPWRLRHDRQSFTRGTSCDSLTRIISFSKR